MPVRHPRALSDLRGRPPAVTYGTDTYSVDSDGYLECPDDVGRELAEALAERHGVDVDEILDSGAETCDVVKSDGEVCGRELPCRFHSDEED